MTKRITAVLLAALLSLFAAACDDTLEGVEQDVDEGAQEVDQQIEDDDGDDG